MSACINCGGTSYLRNAEGQWQHPCCALWARLSPGEPCSACSAPRRTRKFRPAAPADDLEATPKSQPVNAGNLPTETDERGNTIIAWHDYTIREQFPWTRALGELAPKRVRR